MIAQVYFGLFALVAVLCGATLVFARHPLNGAMALVGAMVSLSGIYALIQSPFLATLQVLVYAGAIMMLVVFVIMVLNTAKDSKTPGIDLVGILMSVVAFAFGLVFTGVLARTPVEARADSPRGTVQAIADTLFPVHGQSAWPLLFLAVGLVLLTAIVGAVLLSKRRLESPISVEDHA
ncbi:MAG: NADH-quinone oxidoreductase subunit J [Fibrobacteria bacterium]|nr:NADH-quinone oxidoreductase subunit J [Fibrobacteria bacterium]